MDLKENAFGVDKMPVDSILLLLLWSTYESLIMIENKNCRKRNFGECTDSYVIYLPEIWRLPGSYVLRALEVYITGTIRN